MFKMKKLFFLFVLAFLITSCASLAPHTSAGEELYVIVKAKFPTHSEYIPQTQIVRGTIHHQVPTLYAFPAMNLVKVKTSKGNEVYIKVDDELYDAIRSNSTIAIPVECKVVTIIPDWRYRLRQ